MPLVYSPEASFFVPENVYLLGLMNTADRSLAIVDYALRRRFAFHSFGPLFGSPRFRDHLVGAMSVAPSLAHRIVLRMGALNKEIADDVKNLGPGFTIGHSFFCPTGSEEALDETCIATSL